MSVVSVDLPDGALLEAYERLEGAYTDCFTVQVPREVTLADFIRAFFSTPVFRVERLILRLFASAKNTEDEVDRLASGSGNRFAMWQVENRYDRQLLMRVGDGPIRTWLMVGTTQKSATPLYFGSAVLPNAEDSQGKPIIGRSIRALMGFHILYSRVLLWSTARRLRAN